jgi:Zn-dependent protease
VRFENGYLHIGEVLGAPVRLHWSIPIGAVVLGRFRFVPWFWAAFLVLVLIHELGHAIMVRAAKARVLSIDAHGAGGVCWWQGDVSDIWRALIAWGGVLAQAVVLACAYAWLVFVGYPTTSIGAGFADAFTNSNLWLIAINLIPIPGFDGAEAWRLFPAIVRWRRERRTGKHRAARSFARIAAKDELDRLRQLEQQSSPEVDEVVRRLFEKERDRTK